MENLLLHADHPLGVFHLRIGNIDAERLEFRRRDESRVHSGQSAESANHESRADQQDQRQRHLDDHQHAARAVPLPAFAHGTPALAQSGSQARARVFQYRDGTEKQARDKR